MSDISGSSDSDSTPVYDEKVPKLPGAESLSESSLPDDDDQMSLSPLSSGEPEVPRTQTQSQAQPPPPPAVPQPPQPPAPPVSQPAYLVGYGQQGIYAHTAQPPPPVPGAPAVSPYSIPPPPPGAPPPPFAYPPPTFAQYTPTAPPPPPPPVPPYSTSVPPPPLPSTHQFASIWPPSQQPNICLDDKDPTINQVLNSLITELKQIMRRDITKKMIEMSAFSKYDQWWTENATREKANKEQLAEPREAAETAAKGGIKATRPEPAVPTLSTLFGGHADPTAAGFGSLRMALPKMPSFRRARPPPLIRDDNADDSDRLESISEGELSSDLDSPARNANRQQSLASRKKRRRSDTSSEESSRTSDSDDEPIRLPVRKPTPPPLVDENCSDISTSDDLSDDGDSSKKSKKKMSVKGEHGRFYFPIFHIGINGVKTAR